MPRELLDAMQLFDEDSFRACSPRCALYPAQVPGTSTKSGDNDALKALLDDERQHGRHVGIAPQCAFNSYVWRSRIRDWWRLVYMPNTILLGLHRPGVHLSDAHRVPTPLCVVCGHSAVKITFVMLTCPVQNSGCHAPS